MSGEVVPLKPNSQLHSVSIKDPLPSATWLTREIEQMLSIYPRRDTDPTIEAGAFKHWLNALSGLPQKAIEMAIMERTSAPSQWPPVPGEIKALALKHTSFREDAPRIEPPPFGPAERPLTEAERERCNEMFSELRRYLGVPLAAEMAERPLARIVRITAEVCGLTADHIRGRTRSEEACRARLLAYRACRQHTGATHAEIGNACGGKDHSTIISGARQADEKIANDPAWAEAAAEIDRRLTNA